MQPTEIAWTNFSSNPLRYRDAAGKVVWACTHASPGCEHCYSETLAKRYGKGGPFAANVTAKVTPFLDEKELRAMCSSKISGGRVFVADMTDLFGEWVPDDLLNRLFTDVLEIRTDVTWQLLTKRADRMQRYLSWRWGEGRIPPRHIHVGVSVEDQRRADERIPLLLQTPAAVRFVSAEPLLEAVDLSRYIHGQAGTRGRISQVIVGGESGPGARPCDLSWLWSIVNQCWVTGTPVFMKQLGANIWASGPYLFGWPNNTAPGLTSDTTTAPTRIRVRDRKGGDPSEWPEALRMREFPEVL